jgi:hypothetical protein
MNKESRHLGLRIVSISVMWMILLLGVACGPVENVPDSPTQSAASATTVPESPPADNGYPGPTSSETADSGYPGLPTVEGLSSVPPDPDRDLPQAKSESGVVGGVLIREVVDQGFLPLQPLELTLGEVIASDSGVQAYIRASSSSPKAELYPTGIFIFQSVPPNTYGLIVNVGYSQFPVLSPDGEQLLITVEAGQSIDLGQIIVELPGA